MNNIKHMVACDPAEVAAFKDDPWANTPFPIVVNDTWTPGKPAPETRRSVTIDEAFKNARGCAVQGDKIKENYQSAMARKWKVHPWIAPHDGTLLICGGGPSIKERSTLDKIRSMTRSGRAFVAVVNGTHDLFLSLPKQRLGPVIQPLFAVLLDPKPRVARYINPVPNVDYFIASQCDPATLDTFDKPGINKFLYHHETSEISPVPKDQHVVMPCFSTVGLETILIGYRLGFRRFEMFGFESSYTTTKKDGQTVPMEMHGYPKEKEYKDVWPVSAKDPRTGEEYHFLSNAHMACQAEDFRQFVPWWTDRVRKGHFDALEITFHGDGYLPTAARLLHRQFPWVKHASDTIRERLRGGNLVKGNGAADRRPLPRNVQDHSVQWQRSNGVLYPSSWGQAHAVRPGGNG